MSSGHNLLLYKISQFVFFDIFFYVKKTFFELLISILHTIFPNINRILDFENFYAYYLL